LEKEDSMPAAALTSTTVEERNTQQAAAVCRGAARLLHALGFAAVTELSLASGRRADLLALGGNGEFWIVEVKSCIADFRSDRKWHEYRLYCDRLLFAVAPDFPAAILPAEAGLIVADSYGGTLVREAPLHALTAARRKALLQRFGRTAAARLMSKNDPGLSELS
jgi:hypothetical protein